MRIVAMVHFYVPSRNAGSETMLHAVLRYLSDRGHAVEVYATQIEKQGTSYEVDGIRVHSVKRTDAIKWLKDDTPDTVISHHENAIQVGKLKRAGYLPRTKFVFLMHNDMLPTIKLRDEARPDLVVYNTNWMARKHGRPKTYTELTLRPPVEVSKHKTKPGDKITLVNVNRDKGGLLFQELARRMPDLEFMGVEGAHGDQEILKDCPENLTYVPHTTDMKNDVWAHTKMLLMPSIYESFGMAGLEAMASGIPVVANPTDGLIESLSYAGNFVPRQETDNWEATIRAVLKNWTAASKLAKERVRQFDVFDDEMRVFAEALES